MDYVIIAALALALGGAVFYVVRHKKQGKGCIGCPYSGSCDGGCGSHSEPKENEDK